MLAKYFRPLLIISRAAFSTATASPQGTFYNLKGEWLREVEHEGKKVIAIGITADSVEKVGQLTYIDWPEQGAEIAEEETILEFDTSKASFNIDAPTNCQVVEINKAIQEDDYALLQKSPEADGWFVKISAKEALEELPGLMDSQAYQKYLNELAEQEKNE